MSEQYTTVDLVDAVADDVRQNIALPPHGLWLYAEARALGYDRHEWWLAVFPSAELHDLTTTTSQYYNRLALTVQWSTRAFDGADAAVGDQPRAKRALVLSDLIGERLRTYGDGIASLTNVTAVVSQSKYDLAPGPCWRAEHTVMVEVFRGY